MNNNWTMNRIIKEGKQFLENTLKSNDNDYSCIAFRAGGFCIQPEDKLISCLIENGIYIDSSVAPGISAFNCINSYDFRKSPRKLMNWFISSSNGINRIADIDEEKKLFEVPIATVNRKLFKWILTKKRNINTRPHRGSFISFKNDNDKGSPADKNSIMDRLYQFYTTPVVLSLDSYDAQILCGFVKQIYKKYKCNENDVYISVICHPKLINDELIDNIERFIVNTQKIKNVRFCNMKDVYQMIKKEERIQ